MSVIPAQASWSAPCARFSPKTQDLIERRLPSLCSGDRRGASARAPSVQYERVYPADHQSRRATRIRGATSPNRSSARDNVVRNLEPSMGAEDFSFMLQAKPGAYRAPRAGRREGGCFLHNSRYDFNDDVIPARRRLPCRAGGNGRCHWDRRPSHQGRRGRSHRGRSHRGRSHRGSSIGVGAIGVGAVKTARRYANDCSFDPAAGAHAAISGLILR